MSTKVTFDKSYCGDEISDVYRDVSEAFEEPFNPVLLDIPKDEHGFQTGKFRIMIEWSPE